MALNLTLRKVYLYLFAIIGLVLVIFGGVSLVDLGLKTYIFTEADNYCYQDVRKPIIEEDNNLTAEQQEQIRQQELEQCEKNQTSQRQGQASRAIANLIIGIPLYAYHWSTIRRENQV